MEVRLATFNLENLGIRPEEASPRAQRWLEFHIESLRATIRHLDADALAFQELLDPELLPVVAEGMGYRHVVVGERASSPLLCGVVSRHPLSDARSVASGADISILDSKSGIEVTVRGAFSRGALQVQCDFPGLACALFVVHWKSKLPSFTPLRRPEGEPWESFGDAGEGRLVTEAKRLAQAVQIRRLVDRALERDVEAKLAVLGDFNDLLESEGVRIVQGDARACSSPSLAARELCACELSIPEERRFTQIYRGRREMLDHILLSPGLVPHFTGAQIFNESLREASEGGEDDFQDPGSDHAPFVITLRS